MHGASSECFIVNFFTGGSLYERRSSQENPALVLNDDIDVGHGGDVSSACYADAMDDGYLRYAESRELSLLMNGTFSVTLLGSQ